MLERASRAAGRYAGLVFVGAAAVGLVLPGLERAPPGLALLLVGAVIFLAGFKVHPAELRGLALRGVSFFYVWRFALLPVLIYFGLLAVWPERAAAMLILALMPPAVATPGLSAVLGGNVALALALLVGGTVVTPFLVPAVVSLATGGRLSVDPWVLGRTLALAVLLPIVLHVPLRRFQGLGRVVSRGLGVASVVLIAASVVLVVGLRRDVLLRDPSGVGGYLALGFASYLVFYAAGLLAPRGPRADRVSWVLASGMHNIILGISVVVLYLPRDDGAFAVCCLLPWSLGLVPLGWAGPRSRVKTT